MRGGHRGGGRGGGERPGDCYCAVLEAVFVVGDKGECQYLCSSEVDLDQDHGSAVVIGGRRGRDEGGGTGERNSPFICYL